MNPEIIGYIAGTLTTVCFIPQAWKISRKSNNVSGISLPMYIIFFTGVLCWLIYGIYLENAPIIISNLITLVLTAIIIYKFIKTDK